MTAAMALVLLGALGNTLPAGAAAAGSAPGIDVQAATAAPGVSAQKPDAAKRPAGPRSVTELANGSALALRPRVAGKTPEMVGAAQVEDAGCTPYISGSISKSGLNVRIDYLAEVVCNFYLAGAGQAYVIERTSGSPYNGQVVAAAAPFSFANGYYGYSYGAVLIDGKVYDGGAQVEIGFNLALRAYGGVWTGCLALPNGLRYLSACAGLGTDTVSVSIGSGEVATGLAPNRLAVLESLTSPGSASYDAWNIGRFYPNYAAYEFDWNTNYCSWAPDNPLGFTFESACARHDFGYRNYKAAQRFEANKNRIDLAFYGDLQRVCANYGDAVRPACYALATVYYEAVQSLGYRADTPGPTDDHRVLA
ncbi:phospholipase [Saccharothrix sp. S26]|uniref:phospholipase n=1 Tax=Saccharothrix sp. S26 TaxID=2907215 RepID=UPI001F2F837A|nr:phospholipase [Saccharothrix sp. S26]MCE6998359.1 phospholipase [Saccharothrix sp. S26]